VDEDPASAEIGLRAVASIEHLVGQRIRLARSLADITREELAQRLTKIPGAGRFKASDVEAWESGERIKPPIIAGVSIVLGVPLSFLFTNCHDTKA
jgi:transcriptional regulator with XRE-family HTH domain